MPQQELHILSRPLTHLVVQQHDGPLSPGLSKNGKIKPVQSALVHMTEQSIGRGCRRDHSSIDSSDTPSRTDQRATVALPSSSGPVKPAPSESHGLTQAAARWPVQSMDVTSSSGPEIQSTSNAHSTARPQSPQPGAVAAAPPARGTTQQHRDGSFGSGASGRSGTGSHGSGQVGSSPNYSASTCSYGRQRRYRLEIVSLPAYCATSGAGLCSPTLVVRLHVEPTSPRAAGEGSASDSDSRHVSAGSMAQEDVPYLISNVSVWSADGSLQLMPAPASGAADGTAVSHTSGPPLMRGRLVVHGQLLKDTQGHENVYFIFPSLQLTRPGQWRLGVSLFGLWPGGSAIQDRRRSSQSSNADASTGSLLATVVASLPTTAYDEDDVAGLEEAALAIRQSPGHHETEDLLAEFRQQGADLSASELSSEGSEEGH